jgi:hypothetical protein
VGIIAPAFGDNGVLTTPLALYLKRFLRKVTDFFFIFFSRI